MATTHLQLHELLPHVAPLLLRATAWGGAALVMAAIREPQLFRALVLFEPIIFPDTARNSGKGPSPLVEGARRRRATFPSLDAAYDNYASKPPLNIFNPIRFAHTLITVSTCNPTVQPH